MAEQVKKEIGELREKLRRHDRFYYTLSQPQISDKEYDDLMHKLKVLENKFPQFKSSDSPTARVGGAVSEGFKVVKHRQKMFSLDNTYSFEELEEWGERVRKGLAADEKIEYVVELKIDGVSANLTFKDGRLFIGATRGDGESGEDVTQNIRVVQGVPPFLSGKEAPDLIEIRGEVYMKRKDFEALNKEREESEEPLFANPRNSTSGSLKLLDSAVVAKRRLNFFAHSLGEYKGANIATQWEYLFKLKGWGICINPEARLCASLKDAIEYCKEWQEKREGLGYEIDGVVIKVNSLVQQKRLGITLKSPRWAVAYKFPARQATAKVLKIDVSVGRTGVLTPVAVFSEAVPLGGVRIRHATLHNFDEIRRLGVKVGDRVLIERAGDVIPKVVKVVESRGRKSFAIPKSCLVCKGKVVKEKEEDVAYRCINPSCPAQLERALLHFASRLAMDIEGMGEAVVSQLVKLKLVKNFADIYKLKDQDLAKLEFFKEKKIDNLLAAIEKSKKQSLSRLIYALGIRHAGEKASFVLARHFKTLDNLMAAKREELDSIYEVGSVMAGSIADYFSQGAVKEIIGKFKKFRLNMKEDLLEFKATHLTGKSVVFTGELKGYSRLQAQASLRKCGGNPVSSVSKNTDFVVAGDNPGSKYNKGKELGIKIISEEEFSRMLNS